MNQEKIRVRFAPSPTGAPHLGNIRTALFNWLFAKSQNGQFILRIEDTDQSRYSPESETAIIEALKWLSLDWDEGPVVGGEYGPYRQSERLEIYKNITSELIKNKKAYYCSCTSERLNTLRTKQKALSENTKYDGKCKTPLIQDAIKNDLKTIKPVVRFNMPSKGTTQLIDQIKGPISWDNSLQDDFIILKSDGFPTYHLASIVDDHFMKITHVLRAEEWLSSTPKHLQLFAALDISPPTFAHLPMILGPDKSKLSKRHGATSILDYKKEGYLNTAMINFLVLLGWSLDDKTEIFDIKTLIEKFSLSRISKSPAIFDQEKLLWMNSSYIRNSDTSQISKILLDYSKKYNLFDNKSRMELEYFDKLTPLIQNRIKNLSESVKFLEYFMSDDIACTVEQLVQKDTTKKTTQEMLIKTKEFIHSSETLNTEILNKELRKICDDLQLTPKQGLGTIRIAITASNQTPPLPETIMTLGKQRTLNRIEKAILVLSQNTIS